MKQNKSKVTKAVAMMLALSMAFAVGGTDSSAAKKKPSLNKKSAVVYVGKTITLKVNKNKNKISKVTWKSTKPSVAKVSNKGVVTGKAVGKTQIKATFKVKGAKKKTTLKCNVSVVKEDKTIKDWQAVTNPSLNLPNIELDKAIQAYVTAEIDGINCEPFALLAKSKSSENYRVLCRITPVVQGATGYYGIVEVGLDKEMNVETYDTISTTSDIYNALPKEPGDAQASGGMIQAENPAINDVQKALIAPYIETLGAGLNKYNPLAILGTQVVSGTEFVVVCEREVGDGSSYFLVTLSIDSAGKPSIGNIYPFTLRTESYTVATDIDPNKVEAAVAGIRNSIAAGDWKTVAAKIDYPITIKDKAANKDVTINNADEFLAQSYIADPTKIDKEFLDGVIGYPCTKLSPNYRGFMLGEKGQIWINDVKGELLITAINGITGEW